MRHPSHGASILPAERDRGCVWKDDFRSAANMVASGWTLFGTPTFDARGMGLNGTTQYGTIPIQREFSSASLTIHAEFYPTFAHDDGVEHYLFDAVPSLQYRCYKDATDRLVVSAGSAAIFLVAVGTYGAYWVTGGRNVLSISAVTGANILCLNGHSIGTNATAWTPTAVTDLDVGRRSAGISYFPGSISRLYIGDHTSTLAEHTAIYNNTMWSWQNRATVYLQFRTADYDIANVRTLDSSGNGNHATLGDGSTPTTYPAQGNGRMIFDGGDYLSGIANPTGSFTILTAQAPAGEPWTTHAHNDLTQWTPLFTLGGFTGELADLIVVPEILNATQILDHASRTMSRIGAEV